MPPGKKIVKNVNRYPKDLSIPFTYRKGYEMKEPNAK